MTNSMEKFAIIAYIAKANVDKGPLGKKALQKLVHLSSELRGAQVGYSFELYTYGPFSRELAGDVDLLESMGVISVEFDDSRNGYEITPSSKAEELLEANQQFIDSVRSDLDFIIENFGGRLAKELELSSMVSFILKHKLADADNENSIVEKFLEIKPHYTKESILAGLREVRSIIH